MNTPTLSAATAKKPRGCQEGTTTSVTAVPLSSAGGVTRDEHEENCLEYLYTSSDDGGPGNIRFLNGHCKRGFYAPPNARAYSGRHGEYATLISKLDDLCQKYPEIKEVKLFLPAELISDCRDLMHTPEHDVDADDDAQAAQAAQPKAPKPVRKRTAKRTKKQKRARKKAS
jgi:hypothetical protein